ncbi:MAG: ATP-binding cassette domain-containing protein [Burkholderiales bacterium]
MDLIRFVAAFAARHWRAYLSAALMLVGIAVMTVLIPRTVGGIVDGLVAGKLAGAALWTQIGLLLGMGLGIYFLRVGWRLALFSAAFRLGVQLRTALYRRLSLQAPRYFHGERTGDLMANATNDVDAVELAAGEAFLAGFDGTLTLVLVVAMMTLGVDWRLGLAALLPFPFMALGFYVVSRRVHEAWRRSLDRFSELNEQVQESMAAVRTLRALGLTDRAASEFGARARAAASASYDTMRWEAAYEPAVGLALTAATALTLGVGAWLVWQGELTIGSLTAFTMYLTQLIWPMFAAGWVLSLIERGKAAWSRLQPVLYAPLSIEDRGTIATTPQGALRFEGVTFSYGDARGPAVRDIAFDLAPGRTLGIVGPTGAGKSTLLHLMLRHDVAQSGTIRIGGIPVADYTLEALRGALGWVPQEPFLFSASIAENIALARPEASRAEIEAVARMADLDRDIARFAEGFDTRVGERGVTLSGGQRQRVAIARALLADAPLLLLDDALSAVDTGTETRILAHLRTARAHRSAIIVSHRLSAVADADEILVLRDGAIVERGDHASLLARDGWYASQWRYQQIQESLELA